MIWQNKVYDYKKPEAIQFHNLVLKPLDYLLYCSTNKKDYENIVTEENQNKKIDKFLSYIEKLLEGKIIVKENKDIYFVDESGLEFLLEDMGAGLSSFALLFMLIKNNRIDPNTLLIFDEPEAHLHTEWQFQMSKLLVALQKELGCKILINTHSSLIIESIQMHSEIENIDVDYYLTNINKDHSISIISKNNNIEELYYELGEAFGKIRK